MKRNMMMRIASVLLVAVLMSTCAISGTFAKYVTKESGDDTAQVAKWDVQIVEEGQTTFAFDLFETILDTDGISTETDVYTGKIAPGTSGEFTISLYAKSEVTTDYKIDYTVTNAAGVPIKFSVDGTTWTSDLTDLSGQLAVNEEYDQDITIQWKWEIGDESGSDNAYGNGTTEVTVAVDITFVQVD